MGAALIAALRGTSCAASRKSTTRLAGARVRVGRSRIDVVRVEADLVVDLALFGIAEDFIRLREGLELFFRRLVAGVDVGMVFAGEFSESFTDVLGRGGLLHPKSLVIILFCGGCH